MLAKHCGMWLSVRTVLKIMRQKYLTIAMMAFMLPVQGWIASPFGMRHDPFTHRVAFHSGVDIDGAYATPVKAVAEGVVKFAGKKAGYGQLVIVGHKTGFETYYGHLGRIFVREGDGVVKEQAVGWMGLTGRTTGPHVHYEVRINDIPINPLRRNF